MTPGVPDAEHLTRVNRHADSPEAGSPTRMEIIQAPSKREDILGTLANHVDSERLPADEERPMRSESAVAVSQKTLNDDIQGFPGLIEDAVTVLVTPKATVESQRRTTGYKLENKLLRFRKVPLPKN